MKPLTFACNFVSVLKMVALCVLDSHRGSDQFLCEDGGSAGEDHRDRRLLLLQSSPSKDCTFSRSVKSFKWKLPLLSVTLCSEQKQHFSVMEVGVYSRLQGMVASNLTKA